MIAYIVSTGDEILLGDIVDTNSSFLCAALKEIGVEVQQIIAIGDSVDVISSTISDIASKADICLFTGGLGPTKDDLTGFACSKAANDTLILKEDALESMESYFIKKGFELTRDHEKQAMLPSASKTLKNQYGTAPGFHITIGKCLFVFMPGVPFEMEMMFEQEVKTILSSRFELSNRILIERLTVFGLPESKVGRLLKGFKLNFPRIRLGFRADFPVIQVKIISYDAPQNGEKARSAIGAAKQWVVERLKENIVSVQGLSIVEEIGRLLIQQGKTLAVAEACTGGLISNMMTDIAGCSAFFKFGGVSYSNIAKVNALNVRKETILEFGAVHEKTAIEMAQGARRKAETDFAIASSGIAGPTGGTEEKQVGTVCIGLVGPSVLTAKTYRFDFDDRLMNKKMFAMTALELLRRHLTYQSSCTIHRHF